MFKIEYLFSNLKLMYSIAFTQLLSAGKRHRPSILALTEHELPGQLGRQHLAVVGKVVGVRLRRRVRRRVVDQPLRRLRRLQLAAADACKRAGGRVGGVVGARTYYLLRRFRKAMQ